MHGPEAEGGDEAKGLGEIGEGHVEEEGAVVLPVEGEASQPTKGFTEEKVSKKRKGRRGRRGGPAEAEHNVGHGELEEGVVQGHVGRIDWSEA